MARSQSAMAVLFSAMPEDSHFHFPERGCVEDQPQQVTDSEWLEIQKRCGWSGTTHSPRFLYPKIRQTHLCNREEGARNFN
jgi:hypothetical protein